MAWYKTGTVTVNNGNATVTGAGTAWSDNVSPGEAIYLPDGKYYEIAAVPGDGTITLASPYAGTSLSAQSYTIMPSQSFIRDLAVSAAALVNAYSSIAAAAGAGKFADGDASAPGICFVNDLDTGLARTGANEVSAVAGAQAVFKWAKDIGLTLLAGALTLTGGTVAASTPILNATQTWNSGAVAFTGVKLNVTDTASAAGSLLADLQVGGASKFSVRKDGLVTTAGAITAAGLVKSEFATGTTAAIAKFGSSDQNRGLWVGVGADGNTLVQAYRQSDGSTTNFVLNLGASNATTAQVSATSFAVLGKSNAGADFYVAHSNGNAAAIVSTHASGSVVLSIYNSAGALKGSWDSTAGLSVADTISSTATTGAVLRTISTKNDSSWAGETYGELQFYSNDASPGAGARAAIRAVEQGGVGARGQLVFLTANNVTTPVEAMRIDHIGAVTMQNGLAVTGAITATADGASVGYYLPGGGAVRTNTTGSLYIDTKATDGGDIVIRPRTTEVARFGAAGGIRVGLYAWPTSVVGEYQGRIALTGTGGNASLIIHDDTTIAGGLGGALLWTNRTNDTGPAYGLAAGIYGVKENTTQGDSSGALLLYTNASVGGWTVKARLSSDGHFGLGTTPYAWISGRVGFDIGTYGAIAGNNSGGMSVFYNCYRGASNYVAKNTGQCSLYDQGGGAHYWYNSANTSITAAAGFSPTIAMTLDASGRLLIGTASNPTGSLLAVGKSSTTGVGQYCEQSTIAISATLTTLIASDTNQLFFARDATSGGMSVGVMDNSTGVSMIATGIANVTFSRTAGTGLQAQTTGGAASRSIRIWSFSLGA